MISKYDPSPSSRPSQIYRVVLLLAATLLLGSIVRIVLLPPVSGHETHVFANLPVTRWTLIVGTLLPTLLLLCAPVLEPDREYLFKSTVVVVLGLFVILLLPLLKGYWLVGYGISDYLAHFGYIKDLETHEAIVGDNWYPFLHVFVRILSMFGIDVRTIYHVYQPFLFLVYAFSVALYLRSLIQHKHVFFVGFGVATIPIYGTVNYIDMIPAIHSFWFVPLLLFIFTIEGRRSSVLGMILVLMFVFFHPATAIFLGIILSVFFFTDQLHGQKNHHNYFYYAGLLGVVFFMWLSSGMFPGKERQVFTNVFAVLYFVDHPTGVGTATVDAAGDLPLSELFVQFVEYFGSFALLAGTALLSALVLRYLSTKYHVSYDGQFPLLWQYAVSILLSLFLLFTPSVFGTSFERTVRYAFLTSTLLSAVGIVALSDPRLPVGKIKKYAQLTLILILISSSAISFGTLYETNYEKNNHFSKHEYQGASWVVNHHASTEPISSYTFSYKLVIAEFGAEYFLTEFRRGTFNTQRHESDTFIPIEYSDGYFISAESELTAQDPYRQATQEQKTYYTKSELRSMRHNTSIDKVYGNGEMNVWLL
jgi:hypothetical protein